MERFHCTNTNSAILQPQQKIYSLHRCIRWCLQSSVNTRTWWHRISNCLSISHFLETQRKWSTTEEEAYGVYYAVTKWNYYLQGADIIVRNDHKPLTKFLNGKNANNKVNRWRLELATYNITFEWISGAKNKAADCLPCLVELPPTASALINMLSVSNTDGPAFNTRSHTQQCLAPDPSTAQPSITPDIVSTPDPTPKFLTAHGLEALLQLQKTNPFCKWISKCLSNGKAPKHETELFTHVRGLLYKHSTDSQQKFLALVIPKSWNYTVLVEAHDKLGHQGNTHTYCLLKQQYYWKGMNKDIWKYIANCALCCREKAKIQNYPLQMMEIPNRPFNKIAIDLVTKCETSTSGKNTSSLLWLLNGMARGIPSMEQICRHNSFNFHQ